MEYASVHMEAAVTICTWKVSVDIDIWINKSPPVEITDLLCPDSCSQHGMCDAGELSLSEICYTILEQQPRLSPVYNSRCLYLRYGLGI